MNARTVLGLGLGLWLILLLALPANAGGVSSTPRVNATLNCSPIKVTAVYEQGWGIEQTAEGVCEGYIINPTNVSLIPNWAEFSPEQLNVTGPFSWTSRTGLSVEKRTYPPGAVIPVKLHFDFRYNVVKIVLWGVKGNHAVNVSMHSELWFSSPEVNGTKLVEVYWRGVVPVEIDWPKLIAGLLLRAPFLLGILLALLIGIAIPNRLLAGVASTMAFFFSFLIFPFVILSGLDTQIGLFVVFEVSYLVIWLSIINRTATFAPREKRKLMGDIILVLSGVTVGFIFSWAFKTGNSFFAFGSLLLTVPFGAYVLHELSKIMNEAEMKGDIIEINPKPFGTVLFIPYLPSALFWGLFLSSLRLVVFSTVFFMTCLTAGFSALRFLGQKDNIYEPANIH